MTQQDLFDDTSRGRSNEESQAANERLARSKVHQREKVFGYIAGTYQIGITCRELSAILKCGMNVISGRFSELKAANRIVKINVRDNCGVYVENTTPQP